MMAPSTESSVADIPIMIPRGTDRAKTAQKMIEVVLSKSDSRLAVPRAIPSKNWWNTYAPITAESSSYSSAPPASQVKIRK